MSATTLPHQKRHPSWICSSIALLTLLLGAFFSSTTIYASPDVNQDTQVNLYDLNRVIRQFGWSGTPGGIRADINRDGKIDYQDVKIIKLAYGTPLSPSTSPSTNPSPTPPLTHTPTPSSPSPSITPPHSPTPTQTATNKPNILFILTDDQNYESLTRMPFLSQVTSWFQFTNAYINNPRCCPSRASILSGDYSHHTGVTRNDQGNLFNDDFSLATSLKQAGYTTALMGKYLNKYPFSTPAFTPPGWNRFLAFAPEADINKFYVNYSVWDTNRLIHWPQINTYSTDYLKSQAKDFIRTTPAGQPFFLLWTPHTPHEPFTPAPRHLNANVGAIITKPNFNEADVTDKPRWVRRLPRVNEAEMRSSKQAQYRMLLAVDEAVSEFIEVLTETEKLQNTVIIFMSDNGYSLGEHRWEGKSCIYEECSKVPLLIYHPQFAGRTINSIVANVDISSTIIDLAQASGSQRMDGYSLLPLLSGQDTFPRQSALFQVNVNDWFESGKGGPEIKDMNLFGLRKANWKYATYSVTGEKELYDLTTDPYELTNLASNSNYQPIINQLEAEVDQLNN